MCIRDRYPDIDREVSIIRAKRPHVNDHLALQVAQAIHDLRESEAILKKPSIAETLDWVSALEALGISDLNREAARQTMGFVLKSSEDLEAAGDVLCGQDCGHPHEHEHCGACSHGQA